MKLQAPAFDILRPGVGREGFLGPIQQRIQINGIFEAIDYHQHPVCGPVTIARVESDMEEPKIPC